MDWYQALFGRANPGMAANSSPTATSRYLEAPTPDPAVARASANVAEHARAARVAAGRDGNVSNLPPPPPAPARTGRGITAGDVVRAGADVVGYVGDYLQDGQPHNSYNPDQPALASRSRQNGPELSDPSTIPSGPGTPLSALTGDDPQPYGNDFATWYEATHSHPLPSALRAPEVSAEDPAPAQPGPEPVGRLPDFATDFTRAERDAFDAEHQAFLRQRDGQATDFDLTYMAINAPRGPRQSLTYEQWRERHKGNSNKLQLMDHNQVAQSVQDRNRQEQTPVNNQRSEHVDPFTGEVVLETAEERRARERQQREDEQRIQNEQGLRVSPRGRLEYRRRF